MRNIRFGLVIVAAMLVAGCESTERQAAGLSAQTGVVERPRLTPIPQVAKIGRWTDMTFSPDGTRIAAGTDRGLYIWDVATGSVIVGFDGNPPNHGWEKPVYSVDGSLLAICQSPGLITVLETEKHSVVARLRPPDDIGNPAGFAFGEAERGRPILAITYDARVAIWDSEDWTVEIAPERLVNWWNLPIRYVPSARRFLIVSKSEHLIYSVSTDGADAEMIEWPTGEADGEPLALEIGRGPTDVFLCRGAERVASFWELGNGKMEMVGELLEAVRGLTLTPIGRGEQVLVWQNGMSAARFGPPRGIQVRDVRTGETIREFGGEIEPEAVLASPDGRRVATRTRGEAVLWDAETGERIGELGLADHPPFAAPVAVSPDGRMIASLMPDGRGALWDLTDVRMLRALKGAVGHKLQFSRDGQRLIAFNGEKAVVWDVSSGRKLGTVRPGAWGPERPSSFHLSPDGKLVAAALQNDDARWLAVRLYDASSNKPVGTPVDQRHALRIGTVAWSPDGSRLLISGHEARQWGPPRLILLEVDGGEIVWENSDGLEAAYEFPVTSDGLHAIVRDGRRIAAIDMRTGQVVSEHEMQVSVAYMRVAADGEIAMFHDGAETHVIEPLTWRTIGESPLPVRIPTAPGPGGRWVAHSRGAGISLRDARTSATKLTLWAVTEREGEREGERKATWEDEWVAFTPEGYWTGSDGAGGHLRWMDEAGAMFTADEAPWLEDAEKVRGALAE